LILTKSGKKFPVDSWDWKWWHSSVPVELKQLHANGYTLAIVSNQADPKIPGVHKKRFKDFKQKAVDVFNQLGLPMYLYAATEHDVYRKPRIGMWTALIQDLGVPEGQIDIEESIFVGDAAGRKGDHSDSDRYVVLERSLQSPLNR
jgi:bifunctional polynucleotide phosphatase/kinase